MKVYKKKDIKKKRIKKILICLLVIIPVFSLGVFYVTNSYRAKDEYNSKKAYVKNDDFESVNLREDNFKEDFEENRFVNLNSNLVFEDPKTGVVLPIYYAPNNDKELQNEALAKGMMTQQSFSNPEEGNFVVSGHNDYYGNYLTPEIDSLVAGDEVYIYLRTGEGYTKYTYEIEKREELSKYDTDKVYTNENDTIHIITCKEWYTQDMRIVWTGKKTDKEETKVDKEESV